MLIKMTTSNLPILHRNYSELSDFRWHSDDSPWTRKLRSQKATRPLQDARDLSRVRVFHTRKAARRPGNESNFLEPAAITLLLHSTQFFISRCSRWRTHFGGIVSLTRRDRLLHWTGLQYSGLAGLVSIMIQSDFEVVFICIAFSQWPISLQFKSTWGSCTAQVSLLTTHEYTGPLSPHLGVSHPPDGPLLVYSRILVNPTRTLRCFYLSGWLVLPPSITQEGSISHNWRTSLRLRHTQSSGAAISLPPQCPPSSCRTHCCSSGSVSLIQFLLGPSYDHFATN